MSDYLVIKVVPRITVIRPLMIRCFLFEGGNMKENIYRSVYCGKVDKSYVGKTVRLAGWVNSIRNLGGLLFITLK